MAYYAAIAIGTVTTRMLIARVDADGAIHEVAKRYRITDLGEGVDATGLLKPEAIDRVCAAISDYLGDIRELEAREGESVTMMAMATSASRDAKNADVFVNRLAQMGVQLSVIPGEREAELSFIGASGDFMGKRVIVLDIGGGSTEIVAGVGGSALQHAHSFQMGSRRVTERFLHSDPPLDSEVEEARAWIAGELETYINGVLADGFTGVPVVAVAGTSTSVVSVRDRMEVYDSAKVHLQKVTSQELLEVCAMLAAMTQEERRHVVGLDPNRAPVIVAGLLILEEIVRLLESDGFVAGESDILQGMILHMLRWSGRPA